MTDITTLLAKVREEAGPKKEWENSESQFASGQHWENTRLQHYLDKLVRAIQKQDEALAWIARDIKFDRLEDCILEHVDTARETIAAILSEGEG